MTPKRIECPGVGRFQRVNRIRSVRPLIPAKQTNTMEQTTHSDQYLLTSDFPSNISGNHSNGTLRAGRDETLAKIEISVLAVILYMALFGNTVVVAYLLHRKRKLSRMQLFIVHLAIADIMVALFQVLPQLVMDITYRFVGNDFLCRLVKYFQVVTMYSSTYVLLVTAIDRYASICQPLMSQTWTSRRVNLMTSLAWFLALFFAIPQLVLFSYREVNGVYDCYDKFRHEWEIQLYITWVFVSVYAIPCTILAVCYTRICYVVWLNVNSKERPGSGPVAESKRPFFGMLNSSSRDQTSKMLNPRAHSRRMSKAKVKTIKLTLTVVLCFVFCWAPYFITQMWAAFDPYSPYFTSPVMAITTLLASLNSCTNPWIYLAFSGRLCRTRQSAGSKTWSTTANASYVMNTVVTSGSRVT